ncbi:MAG TPA: hypothetical protein VFS16_10185, partial [Acidimicrobiia bacterium]|nr:hypothetical protein [Acidimicrobiia bacterium]
MPGTEVERPAEVAAEAPGAPAFLLALYLLVSCTTVVLASGGPGRGTVDQRHWYVLLSDVGLGAVVVAHLRHLPELWRDRRRHRCALAAGVLGLSMLPALAAHHSVRGDAAVLRWIGVAMV